MQRFKHRELEGLDTTHPNIAVRGFPNGTVYVSCVCLSVGDYGGSGTIGHANIRALIGEDSEYELTQEQEHYSSWYNDYYPPEPTAEAVELIGNFGCGSVWIRAHVWIKLELDCLLEYPLLNEELEGEIRLEWEEKAWGEAGGARDELFDKIEKITRAKCAHDDRGGFQFNGELFVEIWDSIPEEEREAAEWRAYRAAMEETNTYAEPEYESSHINVDRIFETFVRNIRCELRRHLGCTKGIDYKYLQI